MNQSISSDEFHQLLVQQVFKEGLGEEDMLCLMLVLHGCHIALNDCASVRGGVRGFAPITTRHAAEVASSLFTVAPHDDPNYWYNKWNGEWKAYAILEDVPDNLLGPLKKVRHSLESHHWVELLSDEDWELIALIDKL